MTVNNMNVGRDIDLGFFDPNTGLPLSMGDIQDFKFMAQKHDIKSMPYNGLSRFGYVPDGYKGSGKIVRTGADLELFQIAQTQAFNAGQSNVAGYATETYRAPSGRRYRFQYVGVVLWIPDLGDWSREKATTMSFECMASDKIVLSVG